MENKLKIQFLAFASLLGGCFNVGNACDANIHQLGYVTSNLALVRSSGEKVLLSEASSNESVGVAASATIAGRNSEKVIVQSDNQELIIQVDFCDIEDVFLRVEDGNIVKISEDALGLD